jgi:hypothetical protein
MNQSWKTYEEVARDLLNEFANEFGLGQVQGKQLVKGSSGTEWEIDAKGVSKDGDGFIIVECRRYTKSRQSQERMGALAYRIKDTGACGGIMVSPLGSQKGALKVAKYENIVDVTLDKSSTTTDYIMTFLKNVMIGISEKVTISDNFSVQISRICPVCGTRFDETEAQIVCPTCSHDCNAANSK